MTQNSYDKIIFGAGIFGLYAALLCAKKGERVLVLEYDNNIFTRATWINQARVHQGYHYPRSHSTAKKSAYYFDRFVADYAFAILAKFKKIYAISQKFSYTNAEQFKKFCLATEIPCQAINTGLYFKEAMCSGVFETIEYTFDAKLIANYLLNELSSYSNCHIQFQSHLLKTTVDKNHYCITTNHGKYKTPFVINTTYASLNQILAKFNLEPFKIKYELCEIILCTVSENIKDVGLTVMDGPFFSLMPFGKTGYHSLTAVGTTPHLTSRALLPTFNCQDTAVQCNTVQLANCNDCLHKPQTAFKHMHQLAKHYLNPDIGICYHQSLFSMKAILSNSEVDDSRPTIIKVGHTKPTFISVFSGKINTIYDLEQVL